MLSSSIQNSEGRGDSDSGDSFAEPCQEFKEGFFWQPISQNTNFSPPHRNQKGLISDPEPRERQHAK
jgi:hypothetical protein